MNAIHNPKRKAPAVHPLATLGAQPEALAVALLLAHERAGIPVGGR